MEGNVCLALPMCCDVRLSLVPRRIWILQRISYCGHMTWVVVIAVVVALLAAAWFFLLDHRSPQQVMDAEDGQDALKRWSRVAYCSVNGKFDPARHGDSACKQVLARDWDISDKGALMSRADELASAPSGNAAWDHVRRILLGRLAVGANLIDETECKIILGSAQTALLGRYHNWDELISDYRKGLAAWSENDSDRLENYDFFAKEVAKPLSQVVPFRA